MSIPTLRHYFFILWRNDPGLKLRLSEGPSLVGGVRNGDRRLVGVRLW